MLRKYLIVFTFIILCSNIQGQLAPDFQFTDQEGQTGQLTDYKDQVLYVSFWASWCQPCIANFKTYGPMREELASIGVTLLNVNIDKSAQLWDTALSKYEINGTHVRGNNLDKLQELYQLYSIPVYEIINKKGKLVYLSDAPDRNIIEEFKSWVKE